MCSKHLICSSSIQLYQRKKLPEVRAKVTAKVTAKVKKRVKAGKGGHYVQE